MTVSAVVAAKPWWGPGSHIVCYFRVTHIKFGNRWHTYSLYTTIFMCNLLASVESRSLLKASCKIYLRFITVPDL